MFARRGEGFLHENSVLLFQAKAFFPHSRKKNRPPGEVFYLPELSKAASVKAFPLPKIRGLFYIHFVNQQDWATNFE
jgi:hypothetical protein